jgi:iron complex outermembrane receptor protein
MIISQLARLRYVVKAAQRSALKFSLVLCGLILSAGLLHAQNPAMTGIIADSSSAAIQHAQITLTNPKTGAAWKSTSSEAGVYSVPRVPPGKYTLAVDAPGFKHYELTDVTIEPAQSLALDVHLQVGSASQTVTVNGSTEYAGGTGCKRGESGSARQP